MDGETIRRVTASRWFVPALAMAAGEKGFRVAALLHRLGTSRSMVKRVVAQMVEAGWIVPNPGHGHPLRPEYVPTAKGVRIGRWCARVMAARAELGLGPADLGRWALPVLAALGTRTLRFSELEAALRTVTPRALSLALKQLIDQDLVERQLQESYPPTAVYRAKERGRMLAKAAAGDDLSDRPA